MFCLSYHRNSGAYDWSSELYSSPSGSPLLTPEPAKMPAAIFISTISISGFIYPKIQNMLRMIGFGENVGSGFPKIIAAWKETNWGEPQLLNKLDVDEVELVLPVPSTKATSDTAPANAPANAPVNAPVKLNKTQSAIVKAMRNDNHITYEDLGTIVEVDRSTIRRNIAVLKEKGVIRRVGEDKNGYWEVLLDIKIVD